MTTLGGQRSYQLFAIVVAFNNTVIGDSDRYYQDVWDGIRRQSIYHN